MMAYGGIGGVFFYGGVVEGQVIGELSNVYARVVYVVMWREIADI